MNQELLRLENITKVYDNGIVANKNIELTINQGEIHAIVGENGSGKSTLMKIIFGIEQPTLGKYYLNQKEVHIQNVQQAIDHGIGMVHQHFMLVESMDVVDNVMLGIEPTRGLFKDKKQARELVEKIADKYQFKFDYSQPVSQLSIGMKQKIEIVKSLIRGARLLILDEPTAVLTPQETEELFVQLRQLCSAGLTILFISHKLQEVKEISDRVTVLQKGLTKGTYETKDVSIQDISQKMVGRVVATNYELPPVKPGEVVLQVKNLSSKNARLRNICFDLPQGMILGVAGIEGNGQSELIEYLTNRNDNYTGDIKYLNRSIKNNSIKSLRQKGISYIPEDRMREGVAANESIVDNVASIFYDQEPFSKGQQLNLKALDKLAHNVIDDYQVVTSGSDQIVGFLSGGNIQKVVVGRECTNHPKLLIAEQPTRGVDLGAIEIIHQKFIELRNQGVSILLVSADLNEVMELSDEALVFFEGEVVAHLKNPKQVSEAEMGEYMLGLRKQEVQA